MDPQSERGQEAQGPCRILAPKKRDKAVVPHTSRFTTKQRVHLALFHLPDVACLILSGSSAQPFCDLQDLSRDICLQAPSSPAGLSLDGLGNPKVDPQMERGQEAKGPRRIIRPEKRKKTSAVVSSYVT